MLNYDDFLATKHHTKPFSGLDCDITNQYPFEFQRDIAKWSLRKGKSANFLDCGLGKTIIQLVWGEAISNTTKGKTLILAPLAVAHQTIREGEKFGIPCIYQRKEEKTTCPIIVTNYEMVEYFNPDNFAGIVLDESSILKSFSGKTKQKLIAKFKNTPHKLACTATPAPNDFEEIGNHAEFLDICTRSNMLSHYFINDQKLEGSKWRLKKHAEEPFWKWLCSWAVIMNNPADLGYEANGFILPPINFYEHAIEVEAKDYLFNVGDVKGLSGRIRERRNTIDARCEFAAELINKSNEAWLIYCGLNDESESLTSLIHNSIQIRGSDSIENKEERLLGFVTGKYPKLITKPKIAGFGMNFQHCHNIAFIGLSDSYEAFYQSTRRCWRFGQKSPVNIHIIISENEGNVLENVRRKEAYSKKMMEGMIKNMLEITKTEIKQKVDTIEIYNTKEIKGKNFTFTMILGDCIAEIEKIPDNSIDFSIFSPPFLQSLYQYTDLTRDMSNCKNDQEFYEHYKFLIKHLFRVTKPGRLVSFHCMNVPFLKEKDGFIGLRDFRGEQIRLYMEVGFIFHSEVCIWKDPVIQMQRTKALGLLHKQIKKDSSMCRQGIPDYLVTMRKPGENLERITHTSEEFSVAKWQNYASPIWMDINPSNTLQKNSARDEKDEKHICPLQLEVIQRALELWTNEGDLVLSPFAGIGSEGYVSLQMKRKFIGIEIKQSYFKQAVLNLQQVEKEQREQGKWDFDEEEFDKKEQEFDSQTPDD